MGVDIDRLNALRAHSGGCYEFVTPDGVHVELYGGSLGSRILIDTTSTSLVPLRADPAAFLERIVEIESWALEREIDILEACHIPGCDLSHPRYPGCLENPELLEAKQTSGTIYLIRSQTGEYKIGLTKGDVDRRMVNLQNATASKLELVHSFPADNCHLAEQALHEQFAEKRLIGEWFALSIEDVEWLCDIRRWEQPS